MNDLNLCLEVVSRSRQPLRYIRRWISRKPLEIEDWFQRTTNRKWHMGYRIDRWRHVTLKGQARAPQYALSAISRKLLELETSNLVCSFVSGMPSVRTNNFPESGRGLGHATPTIFGSTVGYPSDSLTCLKYCRLATVILDMCKNGTKFKHNVERWTLTLTTIKVCLLAGLHSLRCIQQPNACLSRVYRHTFSE